MRGQARGRKDASGAAFDAAALALEDAPPSPLPRRVLGVLLALIAAAVAAIALGRVDVVVVAEGRLVPRTLLKIVQPVEAGVVREILVEEGAAVVAGQPLLRLDARLADADLRLLRHEFATRSLQVRRIEAEVAGTAFVRHSDDPPAVFAQALSQYHVNRSAHADQVEQGRAAMARFARELDAAREVERKLARTVPMVQSVSARFHRLREEGFVSELAALDRERERIEREQDHAAQVHTVRALEAALEQSRRQVEGTASAYRRTLTAESIEALAQLARLREEIDKHLVRRDHIELVAPEAGVVNELVTRTAGSVVAAGTVLVTLVPAGDALEAEVLVRNEDAGFVATGQRVEVKVLAYPFQKYGLVTGEVLRIGADAAERGSQDGSATSSLSPYRARLALRQASLPFETTRLPFASGMLVQAEIHLGRRPLVDYLLAPVQKAWHEAARER